MISKNNYSDNENLVLPKEIEDLFSQTKIVWTKSKENSWLEMEAKLEQAPFVRKVSPHTFYHITQYAAAALVALLIGFSATAALYTKKIQTDLTAKIFLLPDKSTVKLYPNSLLSYKPLLWVFSRTSNLNGEALFEVSKGKKFEVISERAKTVVLGTRFTVTAREKEYFVNCEQGKVKLVEVVNKNEAVIIAGEKAKLQPNTKFEIIRVKENLPAKIKIESEPEVRIEEKQEKINTEEKTFGVSQNLGSQKPNVQEEAKQEKNQYQKLNNPDVKPEEMDKTLETSIKEAKKLIDETNLKQQTSSQNKIAEHQTEKVQENSEQTAKNRFRNSLTKEQIEILEDNKINRKEKQKAFIKTLSEEQKEMLREQNKETGSGSGSGNANSNKNTIKDNIKERQRNQNRNEMQNSPDKNGGNQMGGNGKHGSR